MIPGCYFLLKKETFSGDKERRPPFEEFKQGEAGKAESQLET